MIRNSFRAITFAAISVVAVLTLPLSTVQAATPEATPASLGQDDGAITEQVYFALNADPVHYFRHVDVQVQHGVVTLSGYIWSTDSLYRAEKIASGVPGVTRVIDRMELERNGQVPHV